MVASHLLKLVHWLHDREGHAAKLYFLRDTSKREADFLVTVDEKAWFAMEAKSQDQAVSANLRYFRDKLKIPFSDGVRVLSAGKLLAALI
ncbi:MAG: hypothetical protein HY611_03975 [Elusimicrobia bacterium]|nr:hypothetical protein [Elusimicrobiota bacterium]